MGAGHLNDVRSYARAAQLGNLEWHELLFGGQRFLVRRRTYFAPLFLSIYAHEALVRKFPSEESVLTHWTFLTTYEDVLAAHLGDS